MVPRREGEAASGRGGLRSSVRRSRSERRLSRAPGSRRVARTRFDCTASSAAAISQSSVFRCEKRGRSVAYYDTRHFRQDCSREREMPSLSATRLLTRCVQKVEHAPLFPGALRGGDAAARRRRLAVEAASGGLGRGCLQRVAPLGSSLVAAGCTSLSPLSPLSDQLPFFRVPRAAWQGDSASGTVLCEVRAPMPGPESWQRAGSSRALRA